MPYSTFKNQDSPLIHSLKKDEAYFINLRHQLHQSPELSREEHETANMIETLLNEWGITTQRFDNTGIVGKITRGTSNKNIGIRADIDALPIQEENDFKYRSKKNNIMHACGHDGHTTMLLMAAKYLATEANFDGTATLIFQPDEEDTAGARRMIEAGLFQDHPVDAVFAMHNFPGAPQGTILISDGPQMAGTCTIEIDVLGEGGHAAHPYQTTDTVLVAAHIITALQSIVSRNISALDSAVITIASIHGGEANNIIPNKVSLLGTLRYFDIKIRDQVKDRITSTAENIATAFGATVKTTLTDGYIPTSNHTDETKLATSVVQDLLVDKNIRYDKSPSMGAEDFGFMLHEKPGCYLYIGNDSKNAGFHALHTAHYDFNDQNIIVGAALWCKLVLRYLATT